MHDLLAVAAALLVLLAVAATSTAVAACRQLPRMYGGGVDILDQPPTTERRQQP